MPAPATRLRQVLRKLNRRSQQTTEDTRYRQRSGYLEPNVGHVTSDGDRVLEHLFDKQKALIFDKARKKSARCSRRAGKTTSAAAYLARECLRRAGALTGYITVTRAQAKRLIWAELKRLNKHYALGIRFQETELVAHFPNGSQIWVAGADKLDQIEKFRGVAFVLVVLDETASFKAHLEQLVKEVIEPTLEDYEGTVLMIGTPSRACAGMFYEVTTKDPEWSRHHWTVLDNPMFPRWRGREDWAELAKRWLEALKKKNKWDDDEPVLLREWQARWVRDKGSLVYKWDPERNAYVLQPAELDSFEWRYVLGVDLGHDDATAFAVIAFSPDLPWCVILRSWKIPGLDISDVAAAIKKLRTEHRFINIVVDTGGLGKMIVEEMKNRHALPLTAAEKKHKAAYQEAMNADLRKAKLRADPEACKQLVEEWELLQKDAAGEEDDRFENHCADAALYAWREARHYMHVEKPTKPKPGTPEHFAKQEQEMIEADEADLTEPDEVGGLFA